MATPKNKSVQKAFSMLRAFQAPDEWLTSAELSRRARLPEASGYRLIQTPEEIGAVIRDHRGRYGPGMLLVSLSRYVAHERLLRDASMAILGGSGRGAGPDRPYGRAGGRHGSPMWRKPASIPVFTCIPR